MNTYYNPVKLIIGSKLEDILEEIIEELSVEPSVLLLTGKSSLKKSGREETIINNISNCILYDDIPSNPQVKDLYNMKNKLSKHDFNIILAVGGGSVLDMAKAFKAIENMDVLNIESLEDIIINKKYKNNEMDLDIISVPTTSGTGSEVTSWATIWNMDSGKKYSIEDLRLYSNMTILDPSLTLSLSKELTAMTALDAITHALEAYWSKKSNDVVRLYSLKSISLIMDNIVPLLLDLNNIEYRQNIALGSLYAGMAFSNTKTTVCHSLSYPLTLRYNIPHGIAVSMTLYEFLLINRDKLNDEKEVLKAFRVSNISDIDFKIKDIYNNGNLDYGLNKYGVLNSELNDIVNDSFTPDRIGNNPIDISREMILEVLKKIY